MNQHKYKAWVRDSFVPTVRWLMGSVPWYSVAAVRDCAKQHRSIPVVIMCIGKYVSLIHGPDGRMFQTKCIRHALDTAVKLGLISQQIDRRIGVKSYFDTILSKRRIGLRFNFSNPVPTTESTGKRISPGNKLPTPVTNSGVRTDIMVTVRLPDGRLLVDHNAKHLMFG